MKFENIFNSKNFQNIFKFKIKNSPKKFLNFGEIFLNVYKFIFSFYAVIISKSFSTLVIGEILKFSTKKFTTVSDKKAGSVGPR